MEIDLVEKHILMTGENQLIFVFDPDNLSIDENGVVTAPEGFNCIDFGKLLLELDPEASDSFGITLIKHLLAKREEGLFQNYI